MDEDLTLSPLLGQDIITGLLLDINDNLVNENFLFNLSSGELQLSQPGSQSSSAMSYVAGNSQNSQLLTDVSHQFIEHQNRPVADSDSPLTIEQLQMNINNNYNYNVDAEFKLIAPDDPMNGENNNFSVPSSSQSGSEMELSQNTGTQNSTSSIDTGSQDLLQPAEAYPGIYNFAVKPVAGKNSYYSNKTEMFFCMPSASNTFTIRYNFKAAKKSQMSIRVSLRFNNPQQSNEVVKTCDGHKLNRKIYMEEHPEKAHEIERTLDHVIKYEKRSEKQNPCSYEIGRNGIHYVVVPLSSIRASQTSLVERFQFSCTNSCAGKTSKKTKLTLVFELLEGKTLVGRQPIQLKVCMCTRRDYFVAEGTKQIKKKGKTSKGAKTATQIKKKITKARASASASSLSQQATSSESGSQSQEPRSPEMTVLLEKAEYILNRMDDPDDLVSFLSKKLCADIDEYFAEITKMYNTASASIHQSIPNTRV